MHEKKRLTKKIGVVSDLHLDTRRENDLKQSVNNIKADYGDVDILVIAGDMCEVSSLEHFARMLCDSFNQIVFVAGNHEYWGSSLELCKEAIREVSYKFSNLTFLDSERVIVEGVGIFGGTMWTDLTKSLSLVQQYRAGWPDFSRTLDFNPEDWQKEHELFIKALFDTYQDGDLIVTHHMPLEQLIHERYKSHPTNMFYSSDLSDVLSKLHPEVWLYGHTHSHTDVEIEGTRFICNPLGYPNEYSGFRTTIFEF